MMMSKGDDVFYNSVLKIKVVLRSFYVVRLLFIGVSLCLVFVLFLGFVCVVCEVMGEIVVGNGLSL